MTRLPLLTNPEVIAIDRDALGKEGDRVAKEGDAEVWSRPLVGGGCLIRLRPIT